MNKLFLIITIITVFTSNSFGKQQDPMQILDLLAFGGAGQLKYQMGGEPGGDAVDLDDSEWPVTFPGFKWSQGNTDVWFRTKISIPQELGGFSVAGQQLKLYLYIDNGGDVFVNGDSLGTFEWGTAEFTISDNIQPGEEYVLAVRGINRPGWGKVSDFRIEFSEMVNFQKRLQPKYWGLLIAREAAIKLSENPEKWINKVDEVAQKIVQSDAFLDGNENEFLATFDDEAKALEGLHEELQSKYKLFCAGYAHIDLAWQWTWREGREVVKNTSESVLNIMERFPNFKYSMGQAHAYQWLENYAPDIFKQIQQKVSKGRWEIVGGQWVEPDGNIPSGEAFVRQSLYGKRYFRDKFGVDVKSCWIPDSFGFNWNLAQILARSGIESFISTRIHLDDTRNFPHRLFWWQGPDGSKVLTYVPRDGYMHDLDGEQIIDFLAQEQKEAGLGKELVLFGVGNHGGGPTMQMLDKASRALVAPAYPDINLTTSADFFDSLTPAEKSDLPIWNSELYLERFRGCYTSQANTKKHNRTSQVLIKNAEKVAALSSLFGNEYPRKAIFDVWRTVLFNQFHDILPGTSITSVSHDTEREYAEAEKIGSLIGTRSLQSLAKTIDTRGEGAALVIFNPNSWERTGPVELPLDDLEMEQTWGVQDEFGNPLPAQIIDKTATDAKLLFIAQNIPSMGYKVYRIVQEVYTAGQSQLIFSRSHLENQFLNVKFEKDTGLLGEIFDKANHRQVLAEPNGNMLQILKNDVADAWNLRFTEPPINLDKAEEISLIEFGPVRSSIKVVFTYAGDKRAHPTEDFPLSFFTQYISLYEGLPYIEVRNQVSWWEEQKVLKVSFPFNVTSESARYEIPYGSIERPTGIKTAFEKARFEVPAQRWADLSDSNYGVALLNDCKHGYDTKGNVMRLTLLRAPTYPDPVADKGYHNFKYAIYPHKSDFRKGNVFRNGFEFNEPFLFTKVDNHKGQLPKSFSFIQIEPENVLLNAFKLSEDRDDELVLRVFETFGQSAAAKITLPYEITKAEEVNLIEDSIKSIQMKKNELQFKISPNEIRTFRIKLKLS